MNCRMDIKDNWRMWLYCLLVVGVGRLMVASFIMPW